ncbi:hypothetical protein Tsp_10705 [Trichinella spiralis]|uniref:hypothetical protein n=1 Tax=Trichinella spiralis TaxID=6334 RepID=UPI0001EFF015|nr:hypothetical protein Tsp_10705 [Trichinella spiralis]
MYSLLVYFLSDACCFPLSLVRFELTVTYDQILVLTYTESHTCFMDVHLVFHWKGLGTATAYISLKRIENEADKQRYCATKSYNNEHQCQVCCEFVKTANRQRVVCSGCDFPEDE